MLKMPIIEFAVCPPVNTLSLWLSSLIVPFICVSIAKELKAKSVPQIIFPMAFVNSSILVENKA
jgi:hypothetical protein